MSSSVLQVSMRVDIVLPSQLRLFVVYSFFALSSLFLTKDVALQQWSCWWGGYVRWWKGWGQIEVNREWNTSSHISGCLSRIYWWPSEWLAVLPNACPLKIVGIKRSQRRQVRYSSRCVNQTMDTLWSFWSHKVQNIIIRDGCALCFYVQVDHIHVYPKQVDCVVTRQKCLNGDVWGWGPVMCSYTNGGFAIAFWKLWYCLAHEHWPWDVDFEVRRECLLVA